MAVQTANVYRATVTLVSRLKVGHSRGDSVNVIAQSAAAAVGVLQAQAAANNEVVANIQGPTLVLAGAATTMTGS
jgi:hypothetical protein